MKTAWNISRLHGTSHLFVTTSYRLQNGFLFHGTLQTHRFINIENVPLHDRSTFYRLQLQVLQTVLVLCVSPQSSASVISAILVDYGTVFHFGIIVDRLIQLHNFLSQSSLTSATPWQSIKCCLQRCYCSSICCRTNCRYQHEYLVISAAGTAPLLWSISLQCSCCSSIGYNYLTVSPVYYIGSSSHNAWVLMLINSV